MLSPENSKEWFHLLVWHQNRALRGVKNFIPDNTLPGFLDLVIWGHEHDCRIEPELHINDVFISQPGRSYNFYVFNCYQYIYLFSKTTL